MGKYSVIIKQFPIASSFIVNYEGLGLETMCFNLLRYEGKCASGLIVQKWRNSVNEIGERNKYVEKIWGGDDKEWRNISSFLCHCLVNWIVCHYTRAFQIDLISLHIFFWHVKMSWNRKSNGFFVCCAYEGFQELDKEVIQI